MPAATIDYHKASLLKAAGYTYAEIASEINCSRASLKTGMQRKGLVMQAAEVHKSSLSRLSDTADAVLERSKASRLKLAKAIDRDTDWVDKAPACKDGKDTFVRYSQLAPAITAAERVYGWRADDQQAPSLSFSRLDLHLHSDVPTPAPAIDIESKPVDSTPQEPKA